MKLKRIMAIVLCFAMVLSTMSFNVFAEEAITVSSTAEFQAALDEATDGTTIQLLPDTTYDVVYVGRPTKSNDTTMYCETHGFTTSSAEEFANHLDESVYHTTPQYTTNLKNVTIIGAEGATVAGVLATSGHMYGNVDNNVYVYDYVIDKGYYSSAYFSTLNIEALKFSDVNFVGKVDINTSDADSVYDGVTFDNCTFTTGGTASSNGAAIRYYNEANNGNLKNITVDGCVFTNCYQGVYVYHVNGVTVTDSKFNTTGHNAIALQGHDGAVDFGNVEISKNTFTNIGDRVIRFNEVGTGSNINITENTTSNSGDANGEFMKATSIEDGAIITRTDNTWNGYEDSELAEENGIVSVPAEKIVAKIGDNEYATFADALENAVADDVITVYDTVILEEDGTIDLKGARVNAASTIVNAPVFRVLADVTFTNGIVDGRGPVAGEGGVNCYAFIVGNSETAGTLTINSGTYRGVTSAISITNGTVNIFGGTFQTGHDEEGTDYGTTYLLNCNDAAYKAGNAVFNITGGKFVGFNPENNAAEGASTNFLSGNYKASDYYNDDKWYVAEAKIVMDDDKYFATIKDAFDTLKSADKSLHTIKLLTDLDVDVNYVWYKYPILVNGFNILLDLNGKNITADWSKYTGGSADMSLFMMANGGVLTITGEGEVRNLNSGDVNTEARIFWLMNEGSTLTIESGTFIQEDDIHMLYTQGGPTYTYIKGGNYQMVGYEDFFNSYDGVKQETVITGGTFNHDPSDGELTIPPEYAPKLNPDGTWSVAAKAATYIAQIGDEKFETLANAITAAQPNDTIILLANITEDVTVNKSITIDGKKSDTENFSYTGNISVEGTSTSVTVKNVNFVDGTGYAITTNRIKSITVENCTVNNYGFGFLYANKSTPTVVVKNVTVDGGNYGFHWVYGTTATLENVTMTNVTNGLYIQNYAGKTATLKNCNISSIGIWERSGSSGVQTFKFEGNNTVSTLSASQYANYVLDENATLKADEGYTVTASNDAFFVKYVDGTYKAVKAIAQIGDVKYESLAEAFAEGGDIVLLSDVELAKTITVKKDASLDLNGKTISGTCNASQAHMFMVNNGATMTIEDSSAEKTGKITFDGTGTAGWIVDVEGALVLESGTLEMTGDYNIGYAVDVRPNAWGTAYTTPTTFVMNGGKIINTDDGGVRVASTSSETYSNISASFTMNGGEINVARDGVFVQQSNAAWDVLSFTMNNGTITAGLSPVRLYGPAATSYVNGEDCLDVTLNGGTLNHTDTESSTAAWIVQDIIRANGGATVDEFMKDSTITASAAFAATTTASEGYKWSMLNDTTMILVPAVGYSFELVADKDKLYEKDEEVTVTLNVNSTNADKFFSVEGKLAYDATKLEYTGNLPINTDGTIKVQDFKGDTEFETNKAHKTFTFKVRDDIAVDEEVTFTMNGIVVGTAYDPFSPSAPLDAATETVELVAPYKVTLPSELTGADTAIHGKNYVVSVVAPSELHKNTTYTVTYTSVSEDGVTTTDSKNVTADDSTFTVPGADVVGPLTFTFEGVAKFDVEVKEDFVTGYALVLVKGDALGYTFNYNGVEYAMYQVANYKYGENNEKEARAWVVDGAIFDAAVENEVFNVDKAATIAFDLITIDDKNASAKIAAGFNVNASTTTDGKINFWDASITHAAYKVDYTIPDMVRAYLASDVDGSYRVNTVDTIKILNHTDYTTDY